MRPKALAIALLLGALMSTTASAAGDFTVNVGDTVSVDANTADVRDVLAKLVEDGDITLVQRGKPDPEPTIDLKLENADWTTVFWKLIGRWQYLVEWDDDGRPARLVVNWSDEARAPVKTSDSEISDEELEARMRVIAEERNPSGDEVGQAIANLEEIQQAYGDARKAVGSAKGKSKDTAETDLIGVKQAYLNALRGIDSYDDQRVAEAILPALQEDDRSLRLAGLRALRRLNSVVLYAETVDEVLGMVGPDDPGQSRAAVEVAIRHADAATVLPVLRDLALAEGPNQGFAASEWLRIHDVSADGSPITVAPDANAEPDGPDSEDGSSPAAE